MIIITFVCCNNLSNKSESKIEIYLTKNRIESSQGIKINYNNTDSIKLNAISKRFDLNIIRLDTTANELIFAGEFKSSRSDFQSSPLINNDEIILFDLKNSLIKIDSIAALRISELNPNSVYGNQFILTINGEPKLNGYFYSTFYSYWSNTNYISYIPTVKSDELEISYGKEGKNIQLKQNYHEIYKAFEITDRIKK